MGRIHFIGGEKGGVGKSVVSRLLAQYWIDQETPWRGFDTDRSHGALLRYYEGYAVPVEVTVPEELDRIVEVAAGGASEVLVDLAAQSEQSLHRWIESGALLELAKEIGVQIYFWHVMDDGKDSVRLLERLFERYGQDANYVVVLNHGRGSDFSMLSESPVQQVLQDWSVPIVELRALHRPTMLNIDKHDRSFWGAVNGEASNILGLMERQRVKVWTRSAYADFRRLGL